jgi:succinate dehydrogenase / fumarate reductase cytochrome b subunit
MAVSLARENYILHRIHSITGIVPVGYYMVQHLALNTFSIGGEAKFNGVIEFFEGMPKHFLLAMEVLMIWVPLLFHAIYGLFIVSRAKGNYFSDKYKWSENLMFTLQRASGIVIFAFLIYHVSTTTVAKYISNDASIIKYAAMQQKLQNPAIFLAYVVGIAASSYHLGYGLWNFCIRWGITISESAQKKVQKFSGLAAVAITLMGWAALVGFLMHKPGESGETRHAQHARSVNHRSQT